LRGSAGTGSKVCEKREKKEGTLFRFCPPLGVASRPSKGLRLTNTLLLRVLVNPEAQKPWLHNLIKKKNAFDGPSKKMHSTDRKKKNALLPFFFREMLQ
jgi:hypothetical protein